MKSFYVIGAVIFILGCELLYYAANLMLPFIIVPASNQAVNGDMADATIAREVGELQSMMRPAVTAAEIIVCLIILIIFLFSKNKHEKNQTDHRRS